MLQMYLDLGAKGVLMHNEKEWIGYTWFVPMSYKERNFLGKERHYTFIGLPKDFTPGPDDIWAFSLEINPRFEGKGASAYLINRCYEWISEEFPSSSIYSNVLLSNKTSFKIKKKLGEEEMGFYSLISIRIFGKYFSNVFRGALVQTDTHRGEVNSHTGNEEIHLQTTTSTSV
jgi:hypothetical protein